MTVKIINMTQHDPTPEQIEAGVVDLPKEIREKVKELLSFDEIPTPVEMMRNANSLAKIAATYTEDGQRYVMIGGAPWFMSTLEDALRRWGVQPIYAFSRRESVEKHVDGEVIKTSIFKHLGFIAT